MRIILIPLFAILLLSCSEPEKLSVYNVTINYDELSLLGNGFSITTKTDTIHSLNDSTAYIRALINAESRMRGIKAYSKIGDAKVYYFQVSDSLGISLGSKLGPLKIEEINKRMTIIDQEIKEKFLY